jgi:hypothetical protein
MDGGFLLSSASLSFAATVIAAMAAPAAAAVPTVPATPIPRISPAVAPVRPAVATRTYCGGPTTDNGCGQAIIILVVVVAALFAVAIILGIVILGGGIALSLAAGLFIPNSS